MLSQKDLSRRKSDALIAGQKSYIGNICDLHPHLSGERTIWNGTCVECYRRSARIRAARWRLNNLEKARERDKASRERNANQRREADRYRYQNNPQRFLDNHKRWRSKPDVSQRLRQRALDYAKTEAGRISKQVSEAKRRAAKRSASGGFTSDDWRRILEIQTRCYYCKRRFTKSRRPTIDHIVPLSKGGQHVKENIIAACGKCNSSKHDKRTFLI